jgi:hypothetical protein
LAQITRQMAKLKDPLLCCYLRQNHRRTRPMCNPSSIMIINKLKETKIQNIATDNLHTIPKARTKCFATSSFLPMRHPHCFPKALDKQCSNFPLQVSIVNSFSQLTVALSSVLMNLLSKTCSLCCESSGHTKTGGMTRFVPSYRRTPWQSSHLGGLVPLR